MSGVRQDDGTWPLAGARIAHARRGDLRREGYGLREGYRAVRAWARRGLNAADVDVRLTKDWVIVAVHWDRLDVWEHATRNGKPWRKPVHESTWADLQGVRLHGKRGQSRRGRRIRLASDYLDGIHLPAGRRLWGLAARRSFTPFFELKDARFASDEGAAALARLHLCAQLIGARYAVMSMPDGKRGPLRLAASPGMRMLLSRGRVTADQWRVIDAAKGPASSLRGAPAGKRLYGPGRRWGGSRITR